PVCVPPGRLGLLLLGPDLGHGSSLALLELGELLLAPLVVVAALVGVGRLAVDATPSRHQDPLPTSAEDMTLDGRLDARVFDHRLRMEYGEKAAHHHVVDAPVIVRELLDRMALRASG